MTTRYWVGVASREHVRRAVDDGFCQMNHGSEAPLKRIAKGDGAPYHRHRCRCRALPGNAVREIPSVPAQGALPASRGCGNWPLLPRLSFSRNRKNWGAVLRLGCFEIERADY